MVAAGRMVDFSKKFIKVIMLSTIWNLTHRNEFAEKVSKKVGGAFLNFTCFALPHCTVKAHKFNQDWKVQMLFIPKVFYWLDRLHYLMGLGPNLNKF